MAQKRILILVCLLLAFLVVKDAYQIYTMKSESQSKVGYLKKSAVVNSSSLFAYKDLICFNAKQKRSTVKYCDRIEGLNLGMFTDSIEWENYIDAEDLLYFSKEITKIPVLLKDKDLQIFRNKRICREVLLYLSDKVKYSGIYCGGPPSLMKDVFNNVTLYDYEPYFHSITINEQRRLSKEISPLLPKSDSLNIEIEFRRPDRYRIEQFESSYAIDLTKLAN